MAYLTVPTMTRRWFVAGLGGGAVLARAAGSGMRWALLSDTHVPADAGEVALGFRPAENLKRVVGEVAAAKPEGALICGDIARLEGREGDYRQAKALLEPLVGSMAVAMVLGNHDHRRNFRAVFGEGQKGAQPVKDRHVVVIEGAEARLVVLDSLLQANVTPGLLGKAQREWLEGYLSKARPAPTVLFVHHTLDDNDGALTDAPRLFEIVKRHKTVKAIVYGHSHRYAYDVWQGVHLINLPAVGYNFSPQEPVGWVEAEFTRKGGRFTLRAFGGKQDRNGQTVELSWKR